MALAGTGCSALLMLVAMTVSLCRTVSYATHLDENRWRFSLVSGGLLAAWSECGSVPGFEVREASGMDWSPEVAHLVAPAGIQRGTTYYGIFLPLWIPLTVAAIPGLLLWCRGRRPPKGHCPSCGYDLTGNVTGVCSECGEAK